MASPDVLRRQTIDKHPSTSLHQQEFIAAAPNRAKNKGRKSTREKIEKLVSEGAKNYPAYLKLIYTGESDFSSDFSSEDESSTTSKVEGSVNKKREKSIKNAESKQKLGSTMQDMKLNTDSNKVGEGTSENLENIPLTPAPREGIVAELERAESKDNGKSNKTGKYIAGRYLTCTVRRMLTASTCVWVIIHRFFYLFWRM